MHFASVKHVLTAKTNPFDMPTTGRRTRMLIVC